jgi:hypothetical protein
MRSKIADIQKDMILFFIILVFLLCFFFWLVQPKEGFFNNVIQPTPVFEALNGLWTNSVIENRSLRTNWKKQIFDETDIHVKRSRNSEFSLTFWLFLETPNETPEPIFRIRDSSIDKNSPGVWLANNQIHIQNTYIDTNTNQKIKKKYQSIQIPQQSVDFYTIVFRPYDYSFYINGDLVGESEEWGGTPIEIQNRNAIVEFASAVTDTHYLVTDMKMYSEVFTQDTVVKLYTDSKNTVGLPST